MAAYHIYPATKTLQAINNALEADQGAKFRQYLGKVIPHIGDAYRAEEESHRSHMGASILGSECLRSVWLSFRWSTKSVNDGRMIRLFNRGHLEEARFIALLLTIGCQVYQQDENGNQFRIKHADGHIGGSTDSIVIGVPDLPEGTPALAEYKTASEKSFKQTQIHGVRESKPMHYVQMNIYMHKLNLPVALYMMVNKNNDDIHAELVPYNKEIAEEYLDRGTNLVFLENAPPKFSESPGFYKCKYCNHYSVCQLDAAPDKNCRTCKWSSPIPNGDGTWLCRLSNEVLAKEQQLAGCPKYEIKDTFEK